MRWFVPLLLVAFSVGCQCAGEAEQAEVRPQAADGRARANAKPSRPGKDRRHGKDRRSRRDRVYGAAGEVEAQLHLHVAGEAERQRTMARVHLTLPDGRAQRVPLGSVKGTCAAREPVEVRDRMALWTVACTDGAEVAEVSVTQVGDLLAVARREAGAEEWRAVKRVRMVKGTELTAQEGGPLFQTREQLAAERAARGEAKGEAAEAAPGGEAEAPSSP